MTKFRRDPARFGPRRGPALLASALTVDEAFTVRAHTLRAFAVLRVDLNGNALPNNADPVGKRDNPPGLSSEVFLGYERPAYIDREGPEKFAAIDTTRCTLGSARAQELSRAVLLASPAIRNTIFAILFVFAQDFFRNSRAIEPLY